MRLPTILAILGLAVLGAAPASADVWVAPEGDDGAAGTREAPLRTLTAARDVARARGDRRIVVMDGTFRLRRPVVLDARDSGLAIVAAPGATPVISGAVGVRGWSRADRAKGVWSARVPRGTRSRQLYVNGRRAVRARSATSPAGFIRTADGFRAADDAISRWRRPADLEAVAVLQWKVMRCGVASVRGAELVMRRPCWTNANLFPALWAFPTITRLENAYELLDAPGEWYLDSRVGRLFYKPRAGERMDRVAAELPIAEGLLDVRGTATRPVRGLRVHGLTFTGATWLRPSTNEGYAADQSGMTLTGRGNRPNLVGHVERPTRTPGAVRLAYTRGATVTRSTFRHLGAVALDFGTGSQDARVEGNRFADISSAAIQLGGVLPRDHHPRRAADLTRDATIANNVIVGTGLEFSDAAGIFAGYTTRTTIAHNDIRDTSWSGIAIGWGWGLVDPGSFLGLPGAVSGQWGRYATPTASRGNRITRNRITRFLQVVWDGGAVYTVGRQGVDLAGGERIEGNVAIGKRPAAGGNVFYTDGGSRFVTLAGNVSLDNPVGTTDFGACGRADSIGLCAVRIPYGGDRGGCRPYGDLVYRGNWWQHPTPFWGACPYPPYPVGVRDDGNRVVAGASAVPAGVRQAAGVQPAWRGRVGAG